MIRGRSGEEEEEEEEEEEGRVNLDAIVLEWRVEVLIMMSVGR